MNVALSERQISVIRDSLKQARAALAESRAAGSKTARQSADDALPRVRRGMNADDVVQVNRALEICNAQLAEARKAPRSDQRQRLIDAQLHVVEACSYLRPVAQRNLKPQSESARASAAAAA